MLPRTRLVFAAGLLSAGGAMALAAASQRTDFGRMPPPPSEIAERLASLEVSLADAVRTAEQAGGGRAAAAEFDLSADPPVIRVTVYADDLAHRYVIDARTGGVVDSQEVPRLPGEAFDEDCIVETASGLKYVDIREGDGPTPAGPTSRVTVHYTGWLVDGTKFDSSHVRGQPISFVLQGVIPGWREGVESMHVGGKRKLILPAHLAYGDRPPPGSPIPRGAMLIFDVELLSVVDQ